MTSQKEQKITQEVISLLVMSLKLHEEDFFALPPSTRNLLLIAFQAGIGYWERKLNELGETSIIKELEKMMAKGQVISLLMELLIMLKM